MRLHSNSLSKVGLNDVLRRRRSNLTRFLSEMGIVTYDLLLDRCNSMGVVPPSKDEFYAATGRKEGDAPGVSSPAEGVIVLDPEPLSSDTTTDDTPVGDIFDAAVALPKKRSRRTTSST